MSTVMLLGVEKILEVGKEINLKSDKSYTHHAHIKLYYYILFWFFFCLFVIDQGTNLA